MNCIYLFVCVCVHCRCECTPGYVGEHCDLDFDDCEENKCQNGGRCIDALNGYTCVCPEGFRWGPGRSKCLWWMCAVNIKLLETFQLIPCCLWIDWCVVEKGLPLVFTISSFYLSSHHPSIHLTVDLFYLPNLCPWTHHPVVPQFANNMMIQIQE